MSQDTGESGTQSGSTMSLLQRWEAVQITKTATAWSWAGMAVLTMMIGFTWGGWVTAGTAQDLAMRRGTRRSSSAWA
jgi:hypothetical protein